jgi:hypothetical protein
MRPPLSVLLHSKAMQWACQTHQYVGSGPFWREKLRKHLKICATAKQCCLFFRQ